MPWGCLQNLRALQELGCQARVRLGPRAVAVSLPRLPRQFTTQAIQADNHPSRWGTGLCPLLLCFIFDENLCTALSRVRHVAQQHLEAWNLTVSQPMTGHILALMSHWGLEPLEPQPPQASTSPDLSLISRDPVSSGPQPPQASAFPRPPSHPCGVQPPLTGFRVFPDPPLPGGSTLIFPLVSLFSPFC